MGLQNNFNDGLNQVAQTAALVAIAQRLGCNSREELVSHIRQIEIEIAKAKDENKSYENLEVLLEEYQNTLDEYDVAVKKLQDTLDEYDKEAYEKQVRVNWITRTIVVLVPVILLIIMVISLSQI